MKNSNFFKSTSLDIQKYYEQKTSIQEVVHAKKEELKKETHTYETTQAEIDKVNDCLKDLDLKSKSSVAKVIPLLYANAKAIVDILAENESSIKE